MRVFLIVPFFLNDDFTSQFFCVYLVCIYLSHFFYIYILHINFLYRTSYCSPHQVKITLKVFLIVCTLWHDMVQGTIITSYCLQGQLLMSHLYFLRGKLLQHTLSPIDWMRVRINRYVLNDTRIDSSVRKQKSAFAICRKFASSRSYWNTSTTSWGRLCAFTL